MANKATRYLADHAGQFVGGIIVMMIGIVISGWIARAISRSLERRSLDPPERLLIFTKPFRVGEYIEILGVQGLVSHMDIISTTLLHTDQSKVVIPNHKIVGEVMHNYGSLRQVNLLVGVAYQTNLKKAKDLVGQVLAANSRVMPDPKPIVAVDALRDSAISLSIKAWVKVVDYELAQAELNEAVVECFRQNQIEIPFPQRDIRIINATIAPESIP
jgi:small conductance mechanosensitive channel